METVRYIVSDVDAAIEFYTKQLGFELEERPAPVFAMVAKRDLRLWISGPGTSATRPMPDGRAPEPGGWNRIVVKVDDLASLVESMRANGVIFRNEIVTGPGGKQILAEDGVGNVVELFQAA
ncbi:MAG: VOC family protein [Dehalococcoidia bacterium]|jgi:catechol 2,3-dioxygenase-like lactoylglutathione lyase family enzyme|nr:VOC family protein [Dehalococcoidia bacterium]|tara:strand:- start:17 stop:382 length:366 start_codon:yes stop_codon:yes gene_type:complete